MVEVRPATERESDWLFDLHRAAMQDRVEAVYGPWVDDRQREAFASRPRDETVFVIEREGVPVGTLRRRDGADGSIEIALIEVLPAHQNQQVGQEVMASVIRSASDEGRDVTLRVMKANRARRLYERLGFAIEGETATHFLMRLPLSQAP